MVELDMIEAVQNLGPKLYRFFLVSFSATAAEDLVQEVFTRLMGSKYSSDRGTLEAFAWGIAQNLKKERARSQRRDHVFVDEIPETFAPATQDDDAQALRKAVGLLDEPQKTVLQMTLADLEIREIAQHLAMPEGTVKSHIHRGKENIRQTFQKWGIL